MSNKKIYLLSSIVMAVFLVSTIALISIANSSNTSQTTKTVVKEQNKPIAFKPYQYTSKVDGSGQLETIHILAETIDIKAPDMKQRVKDTITSLAKEKNMTDFVAYIYNDRDIYTYKSISADESIPDQAKLQQLIELDKQKGQTTVIASYAGGLDWQTAKRDTSDSSYTLYFFPNALNSNETVGSLKEKIDGWKPSLN